MEYSGIGWIAVECWLEIPEHFPFVRLEPFIVMPDHVHGIIVIDKAGYDAEVGAGASDADNASDVRDVETQNFASLHPGTHPGTHPGLFARLEHRPQSPSPAR